MDCLVNPFRMRWCGSIQVVGHAHWSIFRSLPMNFRIPIALLVCSVVSVAFAGGPEPRAMTMTKPVKVSAADAAGPVFHLSLIHI